MKGWCSFNLPRSFVLRPKAVIPMCIQPITRNTFRRAIIKEYEEILPADIFFRIHNSHIINLNFVKEIPQGQGWVD